MLETKAGGGGQTLEREPLEGDRKPPGSSPARPAPPPSRSARTGEGRLAGSRRRLLDDRLFGDVLALKRWLAHRTGA